MITHGGCLVMLGPIDEEICYIASGSNYFSPCRGKQKSCAAFVVRGVDVGGCMDLIEVQN